MVKTDRKSIQEESAKESKESSEEEMDVSEPKINSGNTVLNM